MPKKASSKVNWVSVPGERGMYVRDYGAERSYMLQAQVNGKRLTDTLGVMTLEDARLIRDELARNRKSGSGPQTYAELLEERNAREAARKIDAAKLAKEKVERERQRTLNTMGRLWELSFWPHRLSLRRSAEETAHMAGRWRNHFGEFFGALPLDEIDKKSFTAFVAKMRKKGTSDAIIIKCLVDLRQVWNFALEERLVNVPFPGKAVLREVMRGFDNEKKCYLEPGEARLLVDTVWKRRLQSRIDHDVYCYVILGLGLGLRAGDIHKLTRQSVERHIIEHTKSGRSRFAHFNFGPVREMLKERLALYPPEDPNEPLFKTLPSSTRKREIRKVVPRKFFETIKELGFNEVPRRKGNPMEFVNFHTLRHTFATMAAMNGVDHLTLMRLMGHKTPAMTLRYIEIADSLQAKMQEKAMGGIFPPELEMGKDELPEE